MKRLLSGILMSTVFCVSARAHAQRPRWLETNRWAERGTTITELFRVNTSRWRLVYGINDRRSLLVSVYTEDGELVTTTRRLRGPDTERIVLSDMRPGYYYLRIESVDSDWQVAVHQHLSTIEEWELLQYRRRPAIGLRRVADFAGIADSRQFAFRIDRPRWMLQWTFDEPGIFELIVQEDNDDDDRKPVFQTLLTVPGRYHTWIHQSGVFRIRIKGDEAGRWELNAVAPERTR